MPVDEGALAGAIRRHEDRLVREPASLVFAQLADLYRKAGRGAEAIAVCREGLARHPHYGTARLILAKAYVGEGDLAHALVEVEALLRESPKDVQCQRLAAEIHRRRGAIDDAVRHLEAAVALDPTDRESAGLLGLLRAEPGARDAAPLGRLLGDETFATVAFGRLCLEQGLADEAAMVLTRVLRRDPTNDEARGALESALRARSRRKG
jgi:tetratricopeptide (TPR) repeat protein